jgi:preprotein translocase subunit SecA
VLKAADGTFDSNPVQYINLQLRYHLGCSKNELLEMTDEEWAEHYAILANIRKEESKQKGL